MGLEPWAMRGRSILGEDLYPTAEDLVIRKLPTAPIDVVFVFRLSRNRQWNRAGCFAGPIEPSVRHDDVIDRAISRQPIMLRHSNDIHRLVGPGLAVARRVDVPCRLIEDMVCDVGQSAGTVF